MGIFDGILLCTDLDGTLLKTDKTISKENLRAIEYFKQQGGYFTFVTGRMPFFVSYIYEQTKPNAPIGCCNGAGLYDYQKMDYIYTAGVGKDVLSLVERIDKHFPNVGIQVNTFHKVYFSKENIVMKEFRKITELPNLVKGYRDVTEPIAKIVFGCENEKDMLAVQETLQHHPLAKNFAFIRSEQSLYEILPKGIGKGTSVVKLCEYLNIDPCKTIAVGDYNNDISMFRAAHIGVAVKNACPETRTAADCITVSNDEHAIAQVISELEKGVLAL